MPKSNPNDVCQVRCFNEKLVNHVREEMPMDEALEETKILFTALADKTRLKILHALKDGKEMCVCDLADVLSVQVSVASHHLRKLRDLKVLKYRNDGKLVYYSLRDQFVGKILDLVLQQIVH